MSLGKGLELGGLRRGGYHVAECFVGEQGSSGGGQGGGHEGEEWSRVGGSEVRSNINLSWNKAVNMT